MMRFRAAVLEAPGRPSPYSETRPLAIDSVEIDGPGPGEALISIRAVSVCGSDLAAVTGLRRLPMPIVLGHEAAGIVEAVGPGVTEISPGDHVVLVTVPPCGRCARCAEGRSWLCAEGARAHREGRLVTGGPRLVWRGRALYHDMGLAAFAERAVVAERSLVRVPPDVPLDVACLFGCPVLCGAGTVLHTANVELGQSVAVIGLGGIGLAAVMGAVIAGARTIIAVDASITRRQLAGSLGATALVDPTTANPAEAIRALTDGGADHVVEAAGGEDAFEAAFRATRRGGTTVTLGLPSPVARFSLPLGQLVGEARTVRGSYLGSCVPSRDIPAFLALYQQGRMPMDRLISDRIRLEDINEAFDRFREGWAIRQVVRSEPAREESWQRHIRSTLTRSSDRSSSSTSGRSSMRARTAGSTRRCAA